MSLGHIDLSELSVLAHFFEQHAVGAKTVVVAYSQLFACSSCSFEHPPRIVSLLGHRLLAHDVLAGL
ncbi:hypothetical protein D3C80_1871220 [compost metagenome]